MESRPGAGAGGGASGMVPSILSEVEAPQARALLVAGRWSLDVVDSRQRLGRATSGSPGLLGLAEVLPRHVIECRQTTNESLDRPEEKQHARAGASRPGGRRAG